MNILILQSKKDTIASFTDKLYERYPALSRVFLSKDNYKDVCKIISDPPLLTRNWLIVCTAKAEESSLLNLVMTSNTVLILADNQEQKEEVMHLFYDKKVPYHFIDSKPDKNEVLLYIKKMLNISVSDTVYLYNRHHGYVPAILDSIGLLAGFNLVTKDIIKEYTVKTSGTSMHCLVESLLGLDSKAKSKSIKILQQYRYGFKFILKYLKKELYKYKAIFQCVSDGVLSLENYKDYKNIMSVYNFSKMPLSEYQVKKIIEAYQFVSLDFLYLISAKVTAIPQNTASMYRLILLLS